MPKLITTNNYKILKGNALNVLTGIIHLAPYNLSGVNLCPNATAGCSKACLNTAGHGRYNNVQKARLDRSMMWLTARDVFLKLTATEIESLERKAKREGKTLFVRPNGTSDIPALAMRLCGMFPHIQFYDYTKNFKTLLRDLPENYHLTFSRSETNEKECLQALKLGYNVAVVFGGELPKTYMGYKVVSGEESDARPLDEKGVVIGLTAKGRAKHDKSGFVVRNY